MKKHGHEKSEFYGDFSYLKHINEDVAKKIIEPTEGLGTCRDISLGLGDGWHDEMDNLFFDGLESIDLASAKLFKKSNSRYLYLGVHAIDPEVLCELVASPLNCFFTNLKSLSECCIHAFNEGCAGESSCGVLNIPSDCEISDTGKKTLESGFRRFPLLRIGSNHWPAIIRKIKTFIIKSADIPEKNFWEIGSQEWWVKAHQECLNLDNSQPSTLPNLSVDE